MGTSITVLSEYYYPSTRAGGPPRGIRNALLECRELLIAVVCNDRDHLSKQPFGAPFRGSVRVDNTMVHYLPKLTLDHLPQWRRASCSVWHADIVWINSLHSKLFGVLPLVLLGIFNPRQKLLLSPRGELARSATSFHRKQKSVWHGFLRLLSIDRRVVWVASGEREAGDILRVFPNASVSLMPERSLLAGDKLRLKARNGPLVMVFLARVAPIKGLLEGIKILNHVQTDVHLKIVGPREDTKYINVVKDAIERLPRNVTVSWQDPVLSEDVPHTIRTADALLLPTAGENFGHSIAETLALGRPVFIPDTTPWTYAAASGAVRIISRTDFVESAASIDTYASLSEAEVANVQIAAHRVGELGLPDTETLESLTSHLLRVPPA